MADPNWFYSTLAQSTAAIVGLAGGFLATRLVAHRADVASERAGRIARFEGLMGEVATAQSSARSFWTGIDRIVADVERRAGLGADRTVQLSDVLTTLRAPWVGFPSPGVAEVTDPYLESLKAARHFGKELGDELARLTRSEVAKMLRQGADLAPVHYAWLSEGNPSPASPATYWDELAQQEDVACWVWNRIEGNYTSVNNEMRTFRSRLVPRSTIALIGALGLLLAAGTVVPMAYLTARGGAGKPALLISFAVLAGVVVAILAYEVWQIRQASDMTRDTF